MKVVNLETSSICSRGAGLDHPMDPCKTTTSWSRTGSQKSFTQTIPWNLAKPVKIFPGIIVRQHHTDRKQMGLLREQYAE